MRTYFRLALLPSFCAFSLISTCNNAAFANVDKVARLARAESANWSGRLHRQQSSLRRLDVQIAPKNTRFAIPQGSLSNTESFRPTRTERREIKATQRMTASGNLSSSSSLTIFPGQISEFRTARPSVVVSESGGRNKAGNRSVEDLNLDLSSQTEIEVTKALVRKGDEASIQVGYGTKTLRLGDMVTAAELAALSQVVDSGSQSLELSASGEAVSGQFSLATLPRPMLRELGDVKIPENVKMTADIARGGNINISGDLVNSGTMYLYSSRDRVNSASISAHEIENNSGAQIITSGLQGSAASGESTQPLNLSLSSDTLSNSGRIESSGDLSISVKSGSSQTSSANITNHGAIAGNNVTLATRDSELMIPEGVDPAVLAVNNGGGTIKAHGIVNFQNPGIANGDITVTGGTITGTELNFNAGTGTIGIGADELNGIVNTNGSVVDVNVTSKVLTVGGISDRGNPHYNLVVNGERTYYNLGGDIRIIGDIEGTMGLTFMATGNITASSSVTLIHAEKSIHMVAGGQILASGGTPAEPSIITQTEGQALELQQSVGGYFGGYNNASTPGNIDLAGTSNLTISAKELVRIVAVGGYISMPASTLIDAGTDVFIGTPRSTPGITPTHSAFLGRITAGGDVIINVNDVTFAGDVNATGDVSAGNFDFPSNFIARTTSTVTAGNQISLGSNSGTDTTLNGGTSSPVWVAPDISIGNSSGKLFLLKSMEFKSSQTLEFFGTRVQIADPGTGVPVEIVASGLNAGESGEVTVRTPQLIIAGSLTAQGPDGKVRLEDANSNGLEIGTTGVGGTFAAPEITVDAVSINVTPNPSSLTAIYNFNSDNEITVGVVTDKITVASGIEVNANGQTAGVSGNFAFSTDELQNDGTITALGAQGRLNVSSVFGDLIVSANTTGTLAAAANLEIQPSFLSSLEFAGSQVLKSNSAIDLDLEEETLRVNAGKTLTVTDMSGSGNGTLNITATAIENDGTIRATGTGGTITAQSPQDIGLAISTSSSTSKMIATGGIELIATDGDLSFTGSGGNTFAFDSNADVRLISIGTQGRITIDNTGLTLIANDATGGAAEGGFDMYSPVIIDRGDIAGRDIRLTTFRADFGIELDHGTITSNSFDGTVEIASFTNEDLALDVQGTTGDYTWGLTIVGPATITGRDITLTANGDTGFDGTTATGEFGLNIFDDLTLNSVDNVIVEGLRCSTVNVAAGKTVSATSQFEITTATVLHHIPVIGEVIDKAAPPDLTGFSGVGLPIFNQIVCGDVGGNTIINTLGDVIFSSNVTLINTDFAIVAKNNINLGNVIINLSGSGGDAGTLTVISGYNFVENSGGQIATADTYTFSSKSSGGTITATNATINVSATGAGNDAGSVLFAAQGGSISLGASTIAASSTGGTAGQVTLIGENGVTVGDIDVTGGSGTVIVAVAEPVQDFAVNGPITVTDGTLAGGTFSAPLASTIGNIWVKGITGAQSVILQGAQVAGNAIFQSGGLIETNNLFVTVGSGTSSLITKANNLYSRATGTGSIFIHNGSAPIAVASATGDGQKLSVDTDAPIIIDGSSALRLDTLELIGANTAGQNAITVNGNVTANSIKLTSTNDGNVFLASGKSLNASEVSLIGEGNSSKVLIAGAINGGTVRLQSGGDLLSADVNLTNVFAGSLILGSTNGSIGASTSSRLVTSARNLTLEAANGNVFVQSNAAKDVTISGTSGLAFDVVLTGDAEGTIDDVTTADGYISIDQLRGTLSIAPDANITSNGNSAEITFAITSTNEKDVKKGKITAGAGAQIEALANTAGFGDLTFTIGPLTQVKGLGPKKNVQVTETAGGQVFFGKGIKVTSKGGINVLNAKGADITFNGAKKSSIRLNGGQFTADPPITASLPVVNPILSGTNLDQRSGTKPFLQFTDSASTALQIDAGQTLLSNAGTIEPGISSNASTLTFGAARALNYVFNTATMTDANVVPVSDVMFSAIDADGGVRPVDLIVDADFETDLDLGLSNSRSNSAVDNTTTSGQLSSIENVSDLNNSSTLSSAKNFVLKEGNVVFAPTKDTTVQTSHGTIRLAADSVAVVMASKHGLAVYNLHDQRKDSVSVHVENKAVSLTPGRHIHVSGRGGKSFDEVNSLELVQYRGMSRSGLQNGGDLYSSEFSIPSLLYAVKPMKSLMNSKHPHATKLAKRIMKTTAVLLTLSPDTGDFVQYFRTQRTALK